MQPVDFENAYYIKLGSGGKYEESSIREHKLRFGWDSWPLEEINQQDWEALKSRHQHEYKNRGAATMDINALKTIVTSTPADIWITFSRTGQLLWCRIEESEVFEDELSRYRKVVGQWHSHNIHNQPLFVNQIPGNISKIQRFQGTVCRVNAKDELKRLLNDQPSQRYLAIAAAKKALVDEVASGLPRLHWKDFETLVDLIFRNAGWRRVSVVGESMKYVDMELEEPITGDKYQVQVKSSSTVSEFEEYAHKFSPETFRKLYFVVHSPEAKLADYQGVIDEAVELIFSEQLAQMVVDSGLTDWLLNRIR